MFTRQMLIVGMACLAAALPFFGCSSSSPRDMQYGTDAGLGFVPEAGGTSSRDSAGKESSSEVGIPVEGGSSVQDTAADAPADIPAVATVEVSVDISEDSGPALDVAPSVDEGP